jgi:gamma-glutamyl hydrolase
MFGTILSLVSIIAVVSATLRGAVKTTTTNDRPIIGVFTQPTSSKEGDCGGNCLYIAASYVKYIESAGGRVVPINYYASNDELDSIFSSINGLFFTGGSSSFPKQAQYMYDKVIEANKAGDFFPLWGTCMGFQWLMIAQSRNSGILDPKDGSQMDSYNISMPLDMTATAKSSRMFADAVNNGIYSILENDDVTMNNHHYGIYPSTFAATDKLKSFFNVLSTNVDREGVEFISTVEGYEYPVYGSQWHPEKNNFE